MPWKSGSFTSMKIFRSLKRKTEFDWALFIKEFWKVAVSLIPSSRLSKFSPHSNIVADPTWSRNYCINNTTLVYRKRFTTTTGAGNIPLQSKFENCRLKEFLALYVELYNLSIPLLTDWFFNRCFSYFSSKLSTTLVHSYL